MLNDRCQKNEQSRVEESKEEKKRVEERKVEQIRAEDAAAPTKAKGFEPPTLSVVETYCEQRKNGIDARRFLDFYQSKGWMVGRNKMRDWQASIRTWELDERQKRRHQKIPNIANHNNRRAYESF